MEIKLGQIVKCVVSGFTGTAIQFLEEMNGNTRVAIQPCGKEGEVTLPEAMFFDYHTLDVVDPVGFTARVTEPAQTDIVLGQRVRDRASGMVGIALDKSIYMNGCVSFGVRPKRRDNDLINGNPDKTYISVSLLEVVDDGLLADTPKTTVLKDTRGARPPGGPTSRVSRQAVLR